MKKALLGIVLLAIVATVQPSYAAVTKTYYGSTAGLVVVTTNPARDFGNPAYYSNPAQTIKEQAGYQGIDPPDSQLETLYDTLDDSPLNTNPLDGTEADQNFLNDTPADA